MPSAFKFALQYIRSRENNVDLSQFVYTPTPPVTARAWLDSLISFDWVKMARKTAVRATICCGVVGLTILVLGCVLITVFQHLVHDMIKEKIPLAPNSSTFDAWQNPPAPIYFQAFFFQVMNYEEIVTNGDKPVLVQRGPYTYSEHRYKENITFHSENGSVSYREVTWYSFEKSMSVGSEDDAFYTLNIPMVAIINLIKYQSDIVKELANIALNLAEEHLFAELRVGDLLWGYEILPTLTKDINAILSKLNISPIDDHFGLFYKQNGSDDGWYNIYTGADDISKFGDIHTWNFNTTLPFWNSEYANRLNGATDGTIFPPFVTKDASEYIFASDICRSLAVVYEADTSVDDIFLMHFVAPPSLFANVTTNPNNTGFCSPPGNCLPAGLLNASVCKQGAPVIFSQPHFLDADPKIINAVIGMTPDEAQHSTFLDIEPTTGVVMNVAKKLQINIFLENVSHIQETGKIQPVVFPILWINESATIDTKSANDFKSMVQRPIKITQAIQYGLITFGVFVLLCCMVYGATLMFNKHGKSRPAHATETSSLINA